MEDQNRLQIILTIKPMSSTIRRGFFWNSDSIPVVVLKVLTKNKIFEDHEFKEIKNRKLTFLKDT